jgi:hypothetical protein
MYISVAKNGKKNETDVTITVKEKKWKNLHIGATTDGNEETAVCRRRRRSNLFAMKGPNIVYFDI